MDIEHIEHKRSINTILGCIQRGRYLLDHYGLYDWQFEILARRTHVGLCKHSEKTIGVSKYFLASPPEEIEDTILHEIAHALVGPNHGHDEVWKAKARELGARPSRVAENEVSTAPPKTAYYKCPSCERKWYRYRLKPGMICPRCRVKLERWRYA